MYQKFADDNWTLDYTRKFEKALEQNIVTNPDLFLNQMGIDIKSEKARSGVLTWKLFVGKANVIPSGYPMADFDYTPFKQATVASLNSVENTTPFSIPYSELVNYAYEDGGPGMLKANAMKLAITEHMSYLMSQFWNPTIPAEMTGMDDAINDAVGCPIYAGQSAVTWPRWASNTDRTGFVLWTGTIARNIVPLYLRSKGVDGKFPTHLVCSMVPYTIFCQIAGQMQVVQLPDSGSVDRLQMFPIQIAAAKMILCWGGDNMPDGEDGEDIFGLRMSDIHFRYFTDSLLMKFPWKDADSGTTGNNEIHSKLFSMTQLQVGSRENHFRVFDCEIPDNPSEAPQ